MSAKTEVARMIKTSFTTLADAIGWIVENRNDGAECPCCGQLAKVYRRSITGSMAYVLILIDRHFQTETDWLHVPTYLGRVAGGTAATRGGDWAKLVHWGLLVECDAVRDDGSDRAGYYKITDLGKQFVRGDVRVPKYVYLYDGARMVRSASEDPVVSIRDALKETFNYDDLMKSA